MLAIEAYPDESKESYLKLLNFLKKRVLDCLMYSPKKISTYFEAQPCLSAIGNSCHTKEVCTKIQNIYSRESLNNLPVCHFSIFQSLVFSRA